MPDLIDPPSNVGYGLVEWQAVSPGVDGPDSGTKPDWSPPTGTVSFTPQADWINDATASPNPLTILPATIVGVLDEEGYLCTPVDSTASPLVPAYRGVWLVASDDPDLNPTGVPYSVRTNLKAGSRSLPSQLFDIIVPEGAGVEGSGIPAVNLATVSPASGAPVQGIPAANALAAAALAAAERAAAWTPQQTLTGSVVDDTVQVTIASPWGLRSDGTPYYDPDGVTDPAEVAWLDINPETGLPRLTKIEGAHA